MDRSSFRRVENTNDLEKRQAFKAKLAGRLDPSPPTEEKLGETFFNGIALGGRLVHPSLGEGTLIEVDLAGNEVLIDFDAKGLIGLVLTQARSFVHAPLRKEIKTFEDPFLGEEIDRSLPERDLAFKQVDPPAKMVSSDFIVPEIEQIPVGSSVWHPDLGACTVHSVDKGVNSIELRTTFGAVVGMALSQVQSKLTPITTTPEHAPVLPVRREELASRVPEYSPRGDVSVSLPEAFKSWQRGQQFLFLTRNQKLNTEQANDVFSVLDEKSPLFHRVEVSWQSQEETQGLITLLDSSAQPHGEKVEPLTFGDKLLWHPDLGECEVTSVDVKGNQLILLSSIGSVSLVLDVVLPKLAVVDSLRHVEHVPVRLLMTPTAPVGVPIPLRSKVTLGIPTSFKNWLTVEQYQYLTYSLKLASNEANDVLDLLAGRPFKSQVDYEIQWTDELPEAGKRAEFKQQLLSRVEKAEVEPVAPVISLPPDPGIQRVTEEVVTVKRESVLKKVSVDLPSDFNSWTASGQYVFLTRTRQLTPNEANDVMDILQGKRPINDKVEYAVTWA